MRFSSIPLWIFFAVPTYSIFSFFAYMNLDNDYYDGREGDRVLMALAAPAATCGLIVLGFMFLYLQVELDYSIFDDTINGRGLDTFQWMRLLSWDFD